MLGEAVDLLRCPTCRAPLDIDDRRLTCPVRHSFDVARQGYVNLSAVTARRMRPDTVAMVQARQRFLGRGHFDRVQAAVAGAVSGGLSRAGTPTASGRGSAVVEFGSGTGAYLARVLDGVPDAVGIGFDLSVPAARACARAHPRALSVVADVWQSLPMADHVADAVLVVFAPRDVAEVARILRPAGVLVVATPGPSHLHELVEPLRLLGMSPGKDAADLGHGFDEVAMSRVRHHILVDRDDCSDVVQMGPNAWHTDPAAVRAWTQTGPATRDVTVDVTVRTFCRAGRS